ncbi:hypothetical protein BN3661_01203 [Eubacteriaceae bacterium CHKCI005]|nr:hypothetical protein BN3661_01203 [Eubacteriaceae bacterium CHKCI005]
MDIKSNTDTKTSLLITVLLGLAQEKEAPFSWNTPKWCLFLKISDNLYVLSKQRNGRTIYSPFAIHRFLFLRPKKLTDAKSNIPIQQCPRQQQTSCSITNIKNPCIFSDFPLNMQGLTKTSIFHYESPEHNYYLIDKLIQIAKLPDVNITDLLDEYNRSPL